MYNDWEFYNKLLKTPIVHSHLREITNLIRISNFLFIELSPTVTKLGPCHIQRDHLLNFYISLEKRKIAISLQQYDRSP